MPTPILELPPTWSATERVTVPVSRTKLGDGYEQVVPLGTTNNLSTFSNRVWMMDIDKGSFFTFAPTAQTKCFSFNQRNPVQGYKAIMYFTANNNTLLFDRFS